MVNSSLIEDREFLTELAYSADFEAGGSFHGVRLQTAQFVDGDRVRMALIGDGWVLGFGENDSSVLSIDGDTQQFECDMTLLKLIEDVWRI